MGPGDDQDELRGQIAAGDLLRLYDYWKARMRAGWLPGLRRIAREELSFILSNMVVFEVQRAPLRFRYQMAGENLVKRVGFDPTGRPLQEHPDPTFRAMAQEMLSHVVVSGLPERHLRDTVMDGRQRRYELLVLPLAADGTVVDHILVGMRYLD